MKKNVSVSSIEYYASFFGVILLSLGLGSIFRESLYRYEIYIAILGLLIHAFGMFKMYKGK